MIGRLPHIQVKAKRTALKILLTAAAAAPLMMLASNKARGIILYDRWYRNKSAPTGDISGSGWQWQANWGSFTGTPIAKNYFVAASHVGGSVGQSLVLNGVSYPTSAFFDDPNSDLRIWKTSKSFSSWAPMYTSTGEIGKTAVLFGRGTARSSDVTVNGTLKGWKWGTQDGVLSWGRNKLKSVVNGGSGIRNMLSYSFDRNGHGDYTSNEGITSAGDSSGAVFVNSYGVWKLAAISYSVDNPFATSSGGSTFFGSFFDKGGLYQNGSQITDTSTDIPQQAYATRISSNQNWIKSIIGSSSASAALGSASLVPEPTSAALLLSGASALLLRRRRH